MYNMSTLSFNNNLYREILSPLDQFEIRDLLSLDAPVFGNLHISITNIGFYLTIGGLFILTMNILSTNFSGLVSNNWSISQESLYATIHNIVVGQINSREGQIYFPFIYTLFIVILMNNLIGLVIRCLYLKFKNFIFNISTNKFNVRLYSSHTSILNSILASAKNSLNNKNSYYLHPYYVTGFVDGEGCFTTSIYKESRMLTGWQVKPLFTISLHNKDRKLLEAIQRFFGVGKIYKHGKDSIQYRVSSLVNLKVIIEHFDKYPLITQKYADYLLFKQSVVLLQKKEHLISAGLLKLVGIKATLNSGLNEKFRESFSNIVPAARPEVKPTGIKDLNWLRGFTEAEGSFQVIIQEHKDKASLGAIKYVGLRFTLTQHIRDRVLFESFVEYLGCGKCYEPLKRKEIYFIASTFSDITEKIIPLFNEYPLLGAKQENYLDFLKVAELIRSKDHLTNEGLERIKVIKSNMNSRRDPPSGGGWILGFASDLVKICDSR